MDRIEIAKKIERLINEEKNPKKLKELKEDWQLCIYNPRLSEELIKKYG